jgi:transposase-like protein
MINRKNFSADFKAKVAVEAIKERKTIPEISSAYQVHSTQISHWKKQALVGIPAIFAQRQEKQAAQQEQEVGELYKQIGQLKVENDFLKKTAYRA